MSIIGKRIKRAEELEKQGKTREEAIAITERELPCASDKEEKNGRTQ